MIHRSRLFDVEVRSRADENGIITGYQVLMNNNGGGRKILGQRSGLELASVHVLGFLPSPREERVAVILLESHLEEDGWIRGRYQIMGASLITGFRRP